MTQSEFHEAMLRGQGRCVSACRAEPERYRQEVLWACGRCIAFDAQCEGSRAYYVHELVRCYEDQTPFVAAATRAIADAWGWDVVYLGELLANLDVLEPVWEKYRTLYDSLRRTTAWPGGYFADRDDFEFLAMVLEEQEGTVETIAGDMGRLYADDPLELWDFEQFHNCMGDESRRVLAEAAKSNPHVARFLDFHAQAAQSTPDRPRRPRPDPQERMEAYLAARDPQERAEALGIFWRIPYPGDPEPLLRDARSDHEELREKALEALAKLRHPKVRAFALEHITEPEALPLLMGNFQPEDEELLTRLVKAVPTDWEDTTGWHGLHLDVMQMEEPPRALLLHICETGYCSCCREFALLRLRDRNLLTPQLRREMAFDSNWDIRELALDLEGH